MEYPYSKANVDLSKLQGELTAAQLPVSNLLGGAIGSPDFTVVTLAPLDAQQVATMNSVVAAHDGRKRQKRTLAVILADVQALTSAQQTAVWNDLTGGAEPKKWKTMSSDQCVWAKGSQATTSQLEKQVAVSFFVRENVTYLVNPAWWPGGASGPPPSVPGDEPIG